MKTEHPRYTQRTVEWGHWGITFMDPNPYRHQNYGRIIGSVSFPIGSRGPIDNPKNKYRAMCAAWVELREIPEGFVALPPYGWNAAVSLAYPVEAERG